MNLGDVYTWRMNEADIQVLAKKYYAERPDHYWYYYQHYYPAAQASKAHSELCERVFGKDLTQDGQADMDSLNDLISFLEIDKDDKVLDLGCGAGGISEYVSDETGAHVTGLDYAASAIDEAMKRTGCMRASRHLDCPIVEKIEPGLRRSRLHGEFSAVLAKDEESGHGAT